MSGIPADYQTLWLNGSRYAVISQLQEDNASEFAATINQTNPMYDQRNPPVSTFTMDSWTGGLGIKWADFREDQGRYWRNYNTDTRFPQNLTLGPLQNTGSSLTIGYNLASYHHSSHCVFRGVDYFALGDKVFSWNGTSATEVLDVGAGQTNYIVDLKTHVDSAGVPHMYAFVGSAGGAFYITADGASWAQGTSTLGSSLIDYDGHAIILGGTDLAAQIDTSDLPDGALASYTTMFAFGSGSALQQYPQAGIVFRTLSGEHVPYVLMADKAISALTTNYPLTRLYVMDYYSRTLRPVSVVPFQFAHSRGNRMAVWNDSLYIPSGAKLYRFTVDSYEDVGPAKDQGSESNYDYFQAVAASDRWLYALMKPAGTGMTGNSIIAAYNGLGLHPVVRTANSVRGIHASTVTPGRLYWIEGTHGGTSASLMYIDDADVDPSNNASYTYAASGTLGWTAWLDLGFKDLDKTLLSMTIDGQDIDATESVGVGFQVDGSGTDDSSGSLLGSFTSDGQVIKFGTQDANGNYPGISVRSVRFKFSLIRDTTNTLSPKVRALTLRYIVNVPYRFASQFIIDIGKTIEIRGAPATTAEALMTELKATFNTDTLVDYKFGNDSTTRKVKMVTLPFRTYETVDGSRDGTVQIQCLQPLAD